MGASAIRMLLLSGVAFAALGAPAYAQTASINTGAGPAVGEIVVTGQRRISTVQNTAASINVVSAEQLQATGTTSSVNLQFATPGLNVSQDLGLQTQIYIRGIGSNLQGIATGNSVATYLDGVYIPNSIQSAQTFNDVERVEVLKGPQATLYGRNATGGAILIVSKTPTFQNSGEADISYGNYNTVAAHLSANMPLIKDRLAMNLALQMQRHDGYVENLFTGKKLNYENIKGVRVSLRGVITDDLDVVVRADYTDLLESDVYKLLPGTSVYYYTPPNSVANHFAFGPQFFTPDPRKVYYNTDNINPGQDRGISATVHWHTPIGDITSVTSKRLFSAGPWFADNDNEPLFPAIFGVSLDTVGSKQRSDSFYHETYLTTKLEGPLNFVAGANYFRDRGIARDRSLTSQTDEYAATKAWSVYIDGSYDLTSQIRLVAGVRYSSEDKSYERRILFPAVPPGTPAQSNAKTFTSTNPRVGLEWRPKAGTLAYFTATSGFKSGGFNPNVPGNDFNPEKVWSYEAGYKTRLLDGRARMSTAAFYYDYKDIQVLQYVTVLQGSPPVAVLQQKISNAATAKIWGLDAEGDLAATDNLTVGGGIEFLHTEFGPAEFCDPLFYNCTATNPAFHPLTNIKGNRLPRAPDITGTAYADYKIPVDLPGVLNLRVNLAYHGKTYYTVFQNDLYSTDPYALLGANLRYTSPENWYVELYGSNLTDKLAVTNIINSSPTRSAALPPPNNIIIGTPAGFYRYAAPRTFGVRLGVKW